MGPQKRLRCGLNERQMWVPAWPSSLEKGTHSMTDQPPHTYPDGISIASVQRQDLPGIIRIDADHTGTEKRDYWEACYDRDSADHNTTFLVARLEGEVVGCALGAVQAWEFGSPPCGWIQAMYVSIEHQGKHVANRLFDSLVARFHEAGITTVRTMLHIDNHMLMSFFRMQGMAAGPYIELEMQTN